ncbi:MAG: hypothetical protein JEZ03_02305 [Bacteroidales bacterium]|nr:hypothetical protein [Bacteroidales bacterium]
MRLIKLKLVLLIVVLFSNLHLSAQDINNPDSLCFSDQNLEVVLPDIIIQNIEKTISFNVHDEKLKDQIEGKQFEFLVNGKSVPLSFKNGEASFNYKFQRDERFVIQKDEFVFSKKVTPIPLWMSILPPIIAILMALVFKEVFSALFLGILIGTTTIFYYSGSNLFIALFKGIFAIADTYILESLNDTGHLSIIVFSMMIGAMVNLITKNGGMKGVINRLSGLARTRKSGQFVTWLMGIIIFFDDYANTLVVGNTMRPVTDRLKISRAKLSYIVDSTAAPIAAIAFITTWIGAELTYIQDGIDAIGIEENAYQIFLSSLSYSFYPVFTLFFILMIIFTGRDFGPMFHAEQKMIRQGKADEDGLRYSDKELTAAEHITAKARNAIIPVMVIIFGTLGGLFYTGWDTEVWNSMDLSFTKKLSIIVGGADSYKALLWSSLSGILVAVFITIVQRLLTLKESIDSLVAGFRTMLTAILILVLAWSIALITEHMHTADYISNLLVSFNLSPYLIPALTFVMAALVAFSTGTSWGTMAILYPLILPASWLLAQQAGLPHDQSLAIFNNVVAVVLAGAVLGDHCSPISDTTILSSLASSCNHIEHVRTQLPYALTVGLVSILVGTIPAAFGIPYWVIVPIGLICMYTIIRLLGKKVEV